MAGEPHKQDKPIPQQSVVIPESNVVEPEVALSKQTSFKMYEFSA